MKLNDLQKTVRIVNAAVGDCVRQVSQVNERKFAKYDGRVAYTKVMTGDDKMRAGEDTSGIIPGNNRG